MEEKNESFLYRAAPSGCIRGISLLMVLLSAAVVLMVFCGCAHVRHQAMTPEVHSRYSGKESSDISRQRDSIYIHDSILIREKGDTVYIHVRHTEWRDRLKTDSVLVRDSIRVHDSIPYPVEVLKEVPVKNGYTRFTSWFFRIAVAMVLLFAGWKVCERVPATRGWVLLIKGLFKWL